MGGGAKGGYPQMNQLLAPGALGVGVGLLRPAPVLATRPVPYHMAYCEL